MQRPLGWRPVAELDAVARSLLSNSLSGRYRRGVSSTTDDYVHFCRRQDWDAWPVTVDTLGRYLVQRVAFDGVKSTGAVSICSRIKRMAVESGLPYLPSARDRLAIKDLIGALLDVFPADRSQAVPLRARGVAAIVRGLDLNVQRDLQLALILCMASQAALRSAEFLGRGLTMGDVSTERGGDLVVLSLRRTKTSCHGKYTFLAPFASRDEECLSVPHLWRRYCRLPIIAQANASDLLFPTLPPCRHAAAGTTPAFGRRETWVSRLRAVAAAAGVPNAHRLSGHSIRVGSACDWLQGGLTVADVRKLGHWLSEASPLWYDARSLGEIAARAAAAQDRMAV